MASSARIRQFPATRGVGGDDLDVEPLQVKSAREILETEYPPPRWTIPDLLPEGLTLLFSRPKVGKSMVALALALRLALRKAGGVEGETLYLSLDDKSERRLQQRMRSLLQGAEIGDGVWFALNACVLDQGLIPQLRVWQCQHPTTCLVVIDVYGAVKPRRTGDDVYKSDYDALATLRQWATDHHVAVLLVHHSRKRKTVDTEDWLDEINGSTGLTAATDAIWRLCRRRGGSAMQLDVTGRDVEDDVLSLTLDDLDAPWAPVGQDAASVAAVATSTDAILAVLTAAAEPLTPAVIAELAGLQLANARQLLRRMLNREQVEQTMYGRYRLPTAKGDTESDKHSGCHSCDDAPDMGIDAALWPDVYKSDTANVYHTQLGVTLSRSTAGDARGASFEPVSKSDSLGACPSQQNTLESGNTAGSPANVYKSDSMQGVTLAVTLQTPATDGADAVERPAADSAPGSPWQDLIDAFPHDADGAALRSDPLALAAARAYDELGRPPYYLPKPPGWTRGIRGNHGRPLWTQIGHIATASRGGWPWARTVFQGMIDARDARQEAGYERE